MATPFCRVMDNKIFRVPVRRRSKPGPAPSEIPTLLGYTAGLVDTKWLRMAARKRR
ncbi:protein NinE-like protein [Escherichia coli M056]|uniref:NinE family protein n=1 Tax=Escherichia coli TaxID=562 RepID=UPI000A187BB3|nr:NinE family protein [Escherichia coli]OSK23647.1 protein NinE-like protein [Escherichia coli M056]